MTRTYKGRAPYRRYPLQNLIDAMGCTSELEARRRLGVTDESRRNWREWADRGMTERAAERWAVEAGLHPWVVWPEIGERAVEEVRAYQRKQRAKHFRRYYRRHERVRAEHQKRVRAYRATYGEAINKQRRTRYATDPEYRERRKAQARAAYYKARDRAA